MVVINKTGCRINIQWCTADNQHIRFRNGPHTLADGGIIQTFFIEHNIRFHHTAALLTSRHTLGSRHIIQIIELTALHTVILHNGAMELIDFLWTGFLMQSVNVLCNNCFQLTDLLQFRQCLMGFIRFCLSVKHGWLVKIIENLRLSHKKCMRKNLFRWTAVFVNGIIDTCLTSEIRNTAFCRYPCTTEKYNIIRCLNHCF